MDLLSTHPVKKLDLGFHGNLFGGKLLSWLDAAVAAYAMEKCRSQNMITIAIDKCVFTKPAKERNLVKIYAEVAKIGADVVTLPPKIFKQLIKHELTDQGLEIFLSDWKKSGKQIS